MAEDDVIEVRPVLPWQVVPDLPFGSGEHRTVAMLTYANGDGTEAHIVHVFSDAKAMLTHLAGVDDRASAAFEFIETTGYEIYGSSGKQVLETIWAC